jgi:hypothetical protein
MGIEISIVNICDMYPIATPLGQAIDFVVRKYVSRSVPIMDGGYNFVGRVDNNAWFIVLSMTFFGLSID